MNKKGAITDILVFIVLALGFVLFLGAFLFGANQIKEALEDSPAVISSEYNLSQISILTVSQVVDGMDNVKMGSFILIFGMFLSIIITSFLVRVHPVFFLLYIFVAVIAVIIAVPISNFYEELLDDPLLGESYRAFTASSWIMLNLPIWVAIIGILGATFLVINMNRLQEGFSGPF